MFLFLVILAVLVFYILVKNNSTKNGAAENDEATYLQVAIHELSVVAEKSPNKSVRELIEDYKKRLKILSSSETESTDLKTASLENLWSNWYSNNSINLLLYMGAFLIIASASIFVGFQWETISGTIKASLLTLTAVAFFGFGLWFFSMPKIRNAGNTFIAIAALLIPVCGSAWYNFVFKDLGMGVGPVWFTTSAIALGVYLFLTFWYKNRFYTYISSLTSLSLAFSLVNTFNLSSDYYILTGIFTSFILLLSSLALKGQDKSTQKYTQIPLTISAQIMMPAILFYGLFIAMDQHKLATLQASLSIFLASGFYLLSYLDFKKSWYVAISEVLFSLGVILFSSWQKLDTSLVLYALTLVAFAYIYLALVMKNLKLNDEQDVSIIVGLIQIFSSFIIALNSRIDPAHIALLSVALVISGIAIAYIKKAVVFIGISIAFTAETIYLYYAEVFKIHDLQNLGIIYFIIGLAGYASLLYLRKKYHLTNTFGLASGFYFALSLLFTLDSTLYLIVLGFLIAITTVHMAWQFEQPILIYISNSLITFSVFNFLRYYRIDGNFYPFIYAGLAYAYYVASIVNKKYSDIYRSSALVLSIINPMIFGAQSSLFGKTILERNALIAAYSATALFGFDVYLKRMPHFGYITSVLGMLSYFWQLCYLGIDENLAYTLPLGIYFLALAYTRKLKNDKDNRKTLDLIGLLFLLTPSLFLSFGAEAMKYSVTSGLVGIILLGAGITLSYKFYRYGGILGIVFAVLPQTYNYILALPRWVAVGIVGIIFIAFAIYLSLRKKSDTD